MQSQQPQKENSLKLADDVDATLVVTIMSGADMLPCDSNGLSDPFAVLTLGSQKGVKHKTKVQKVILMCSMGLNLDWFKIYGL